MASRAAARYREFKVMLRDEELASYSGVGMTLETVLDSEAPGVAPPCEDMGRHDLVIWEGPAVVAVIRFRGEEMPEVLRLKG